MTRAPRTIVELNIDFERIEAMRDAREFATLAELRSQLFKMQTRVLKFVDDELVRKKLKTAVTRFKMPLVSKYREIVRRRMLNAHNHGRTDTSKELSLRKRKPKQPELQQVREVADALVVTHISKLEGDLKREWAKAMQPPIDKSQLRYVTKKVFADFVGWVQPEPE